MEILQGKKFEKPAPGMYLATLVDVHEKRGVATPYGLKDKVQLYWLISNLYTGQLVLDKDGQPLEAFASYNGTMGKGSELGKKVAAILGQAPPLINSTEQLEQLLIGRQNVLVLVLSENKADANDPFVNVDAIAPIQQGMPPAPQIPPTYVRRKNRVKVQAGPQGPVATYAQPPAQPVSHYPVAPGYAAPAPTYAPPAAPAPAAAPYYAPPAVPAPQPPTYAVPPTGAPVNLNAGAPPAPVAGDPNAKRPF
jgi:hypothetical protein